MKRFLLLAAVGSASITLTGCQNEDAANEQDNAAYGAAAEGSAESASEVDAAAGGGEAGTANATTLPEGSRVVVENGVRYRVDASGTRVRITDDQPVIYVENGVRYRVDPAGTRVRIGPDGAELEIADDDVNARVRTDDPSVEVNVNKR